MNQREKYFWVYDILLLLVLVLAGWLRLDGVGWGEGEHQHPDENFLSSVLGSLQAHKCADETIPIEACPEEQQVWLSIGDYFDSQTSTLNPYNRGFSFFVYGDLPMTLSRVTAEATGQLDVKILGRQLSAFADLFTILILYAIVSRLYNRRIALLASLFSALTVMQIQQSHFFTTDLFVNPFAFLAIYFAIAIVDTKEKRLETGDLSADTRGNLKSLISNPQILRSLITHPLFLLSLGFGFAYGMALASKVNIYPLAVLLPGAFVLRYFIVDRKQPTIEEENAVSGQWSASTNYYLLITLCLLAGGLAALISFRVFQPYAFDGLLPSEHWIANIQEQRVQAKGDADLPWNLQWARRSHLYSFINLTVWGLGLPLGILAWIGFLTMGWRILTGEWRHALLWGWTAAYFLWQSLQFNPTMRYQLPIYPLLAMMAAWFVFEPIRSTKHAVRTEYSVLRIGFAVIVIVLTAIWGFAFQSIYTRDEPRIAASRWIFQNVPGPINLQIESDTSTYSQPLPFPTGVYIQPSAPFQTSFVPKSDGLLKEISLAHVVSVPDQISTQLYLTVWQGLSDPQPLASGITAEASQDILEITSRVVNFEQAPALIANQTYYLKFETMTPDGLINICGPLRLSIQSGDQASEQIAEPSKPCTVSPENPYTISFIPQTDGALTATQWN